MSCAVRITDALRPVLVTGSEPSGEPVPLPPPGQYYPRSSGLDLHPGVNLDFAMLNQRLSDTLAGESLVIKGRKVGIRKLSLSGSGQEIRVRREGFLPVGAKSMIIAWSP